MGIAGTEKNTEESNTNAKENFDGIPVNVECPAKDAVAEHRAPTSHHRYSHTIEEDGSREAVEDKLQP
jgi:hypothetical protein